MSPLKTKQKIVHKSNQEIAYLRKLSPRFNTTMYIKQLAPSYYLGKEYVLTKVLNG